MIKAEYDRRGYDEGQVRYEEMNINAVLRAKEDDIIIMNIHYLHLLTIYMRTQSVRERSKQGKFVVVELRMDMSHERKIQ